jgi:aminoglycoside phosphotransferase (APT) family kinase protein
VNGPRWAGERPCPADRAAALVAAAFPQLAGLPVVPLAEGCDNTVHRVGDTWVFRFPRRALALPAFRRELTVLPRLAPLMPLPVPVPELIAADEEEDRGRSPGLGCCRGGRWPRRPCPTAGGADRDPST